jgi:hypothetical protein
LGAKSFGVTLCVDEDTDQARVFGKKGREVLSIKIRLSENHSLTIAAALMAAECGGLKEIRRPFGPADRWCR